MRIFAVSDLHTDHQANREWIQHLSTRDYLNDVVIIAGDVSDRLSRLEEALWEFSKRFESVFYVPGNHELWIRQNECSHSIQKFEKILKVCEQTGVHTKAKKVGTGDKSHWIIPLFSWYMQPEEGEDSLFLAKPSSIVDKTAEMWNDFHFTQWPTMNGVTVADYFLNLNEPYLEQEYDAPVITFSHFLPRQDLIFSNPGGVDLQDIDYSKDPIPPFNFTRVAGSQRIEQQIRALESSIHVYGHQHRHRDRVVDGVRYISHCLGYPRERKNPWFYQHGQTPLQILDTSA